MPVEVKFFAGFRDLVDKKKIEVSAETVNGLLQSLIESNAGMEEKLFSNEDGRVLRSSVNIMVNGRRIDNLDGLSTTLKDGDAVAIFPPVSGGLSSSGYLYFS